MKGHPPKQILTAWLAGWAATFFGYAGAANLSLLWGDEPARIFGAVFETADAMPPSAKLVLGAVLLCAVLIALGRSAAAQLFVLPLGAFAGLIASTLLPDGHALAFGGDVAALASGALLGGVVATLLLGGRRRAVATPPASLR